MNVKRKRSRIFGACILLMMAVLALGTVTFVAIAEEGDLEGSYSLVIRKEFAEGTPEDVLEEAKKQSYTFKIEGTRKEKRKVDGEWKWVDVKVYTTVTLPQKTESEDSWESGKMISEGPFNVTVTEITDNVNIVDGNGNHYNMSGSSSDTRVTINSRKHEVPLRNNSTLTIHRPENAGGGPEELWYRVTNRPYDGHKTGNYKSVDTVFSLRADEEKTFTTLCAAIYTIEQIAAPDGYQLQMGAREETVPAGGEGHFYINGTPGRLTLTAGGSKGDGRTYYYTLERTETEEGDTSEFKTRRVDVASGESYVLDDLPKGGYTVKEYTAGADEKYTVTMSQTDERDGSGKSSALTSGTTNKWIRMNLDLSRGDVDYIKMVSFGPLYDSNNNRLSSSHTYTAFKYVVPADDGKLYTKDIKSYSKSAGFSGYTEYKITDAVKIKVGNYKQIGFTVLGVNSSVAKRIGVSWIEYDEKETPATFEKAGIEKSITVDDRKWLKIDAPALKDSNAPDAGSIAYYYTLKKDGNLISGMTDRDGTTVKLLPGQSTELTLPEAGTYTIEETITGRPMGFTMRIEGAPFGTTETGKEIKVQVGGERTVTISKPDVSIRKNGETDNREYTFNVSGGGFPERVTLKAGESKTVTLPKEGEYTIMPGGESLGSYELNYTDSGAIYGTASGSMGQITFTNSFSAGEFGYRFVHEYYVKEADGTYTYEGNSQITTRLGREETETYQALDISQAPEFQGITYTHFDEAYGFVDGIQPKENLSRAYLLATPSSADEIPVEDYEEAYDRRYLLATASSARKVSDRKISDDDISDKEIQDDDIWDDDILDEDILDEDLLDEDEDESYNRTYRLATASSAREIRNENAAGTYGRTYRLATSSSADGIPDGDRMGIYGGAYTPATPSSARAALDKMASRALSDKEPDCDSDGIVNRGIGDDSDGNSLNYAPVPDMDYIDVTKDASQIIILRYYRERKPKGTYNVIHVYYFRDSEGDHWEGTSGILPQDGELGIKYTGDKVKKVYDFRPADAKQTYTYTWDLRPQYGEVENSNQDNSENEFAGNGKVYRPNNARTSVEGTAEGNQIIILRYYRDLSPKGSYNIVHEYYFREDSENSEDASEDSERRRAAWNQDDDSETGEGEEDISDGFTFNGTINRDDGYAYTYEGRTEIELLTASLGETFTEANVVREFGYKGNTYTYIDAGYGLVSDRESYSCNPNQQWATSTSTGNEVIILRYYRGAPPETPPEKPRNPSGGGGGGGSTPPSPPGDPEPPSENPETPHEEPEYPTELPDPNNPESPEQITILVNGVPTSYIKVWDPELEEWVYLMESEVPLSDMGLGLPKTGDDRRIILGMMLAAGSLCGMGVLSLSFRKRRDK